LPSHPSHITATDYLQGTQIPISAAGETSFQFRIVPCVTYPSFLVTYSYKEQANIITSWTVLQLNYSAILHENDSNKGEQEKWYVNILSSET
jgi:hypothetical protein